MVGKGGGADDDAMSALLHQLARAVGGPNSTADAATGARRQELHQVVVGSPADRRVEVNHLDLAKRREAFQHLGRSAALQSFIAALD